MKTRSGFVSNSSSSSFVVLGIKVPQSVFEEAGGYEKLDKRLYCDQPEGEKFVIVGKKIGSWDDSDGGICTKSLTEVTKEAFELSKTLAEIFPDNTQDISLLYGTVYC